MTELATTLVLGGARSGKSAFAERLVADSGLVPIYLATATADDDEMKARIAHHRAQRGQSGQGWTTIEEPLALVDALTREATHGRAVLVDCLTLWLSNLMLAGGRQIDADLTAAMAAAKESSVEIILVTNEVGCGIVPENALAREFRDRAGAMNQRFAQAADEVYWMVFGQALRVK